MKISTLGVVVLSVTSIALELLAPAATTPPNPGYIHRVDFHGKTFWTDDEGATSTGAVPVDADKGFVPAAHGPSFGPVVTDPHCAQPPAQAIRDHATFSQAELATYGLPERLNGQSLEEWQTIVRHADTRSCSAQNSYLDGRPTKNGQAWGHTMTPIKRLVPITPTGIGAGYSEVFLAKPDQAQAGWAVHETDYIETEVVAYWHWATITTSPSLYHENMSTWDAVGDDSIYTGCSNLPGMVQAGTASQNSQGSAYYYLWVQNLGSSVDCGEQVVLNNATYNGDLMYVAVPYTGNIFLQDQTHNWYFSEPAPLCGCGTTPAYTGSSACMTENNGGQLVWPKFGVEDFQWCRTYVNVSGTTSLYSMMHLPGNAQLFRHHAVNTLNNPQYPANYCAYAELPNNPTNPTYPDSSFNVDYIQGCA